DPTHQVTIYRYLNPRAAVWPEADYIVSNPPFIGTKKVLEMLGCKYVEVLRETYSSLPATIDYVMYWWEKCALLVKSKEVYAFGLITTNSIRQIENRKIIQGHTNSNNLMNLFFAIADHPWVDQGANVRIAMTGLKQGKAEGRAGIIINESKNNNPDENEDDLQIEWKIGKIYDDLKVGIDTTKVIKLSANYGLCSQGCKLVQRRRRKGEDWEQGFLLRAGTAKKYGFGIRTDNIIRPYITGDDITGLFRNSFVIDFHGLTREEAATTHSEAYQRILEQVKPFRDQNNMPRRRDYWWLFGAPAERMRESVQKLSQYIVTSEVAKHRVFVFTDSQTLADGSTFIFAFDDPYFLGVLSSQIHVSWSLTAGGTLEDRPRYNNSVCFDPFPFPDPTDTQKQTIRELGERLDSHRKRVQATHPEVTITGMYNLLEKLRKGEPLNDKDKAFNQKALVSTLKQIHDELDRAVFAAYGWEPTLTDEQILENLVTLNAQRAEEERNGLIRWLRPDYQSPGETYVQPTLEGITTETETAIIPAEQQPFPKTLKEQLSAIRDLFRTQSGEWTAAQVTAHFKGANRKQKVILDCLESLEDLGILLSHAENGVQYWYLPT
ncbi:class I SAM-dependent DNA methyltransferase, partial [filamentous cyanobacterium Phorm 46]